MKATKLAFEERYCDDSGIEFAVRFDANDDDGAIEFERINKVDFPIGRLSWLIECLRRIQAEAIETPASTVKDAP
jgi:hypothetical protein